MIVVMIIQLRFTLLSLNDNISRQRTTAVWPEATAKPANRQVSKGQGDHHRSFLPDALIFCRYCSC